MRICLWRFCYVLPTDGLLLRLNEWDSLLASVWNLSKGPTDLRRCFGNFFSNHSKHQAPPKKKTALFSMQFFGLRGLLVGWGMVPMPWHGMVLCHGFNQANLSANLRVPQQLSWKMLINGWGDDPGRAAKVVHWGYLLIHQKCGKLLGRFYVFPPHKWG